MSGELIRTIRHGSSKIIWADEQPEQEPKLSDQIEILTGAIRNIEKNWENANLAPAVRHAIKQVELIESNRYWASSEWHVDDVKSAIVGTKFESNVMPTDYTLTDYLQTQINNDYFVGEINDQIAENLRDLWDSAGFPKNVEIPARQIDAQPEQDTPTTPSVPKIPSDGERIAGAKEVLLDPDIGNYDTGWAVFAACNDCIHEALSGSNSRMSGVLTETGDVVIQVDSDDCTYH